MVDFNDIFHAKNQMDRETLREFERGCPTSVCRSIAADHIGKPTSLPSVGGETPGFVNIVPFNDFPKPWGLEHHDSKGQLKRTPPSDAE